MKEIKAYIRIRVVHDVVDALERAGFCCVTVIDVSALDLLADPKTSKYSLEYIEKYSTVVKLELACKNEDVETVENIIKRSARTHQPGDGIILVSSIDRAIKIRTGEEGAQILQS